MTAKAYRRALALLELDRGQTYTKVSKTLQVTIPTISGGQRSTLKMDYKFYTIKLVLGAPSKLMERNGQRLQRWLVVLRQKAMPSGACGF